MSLLKADFTQLDWLTKLQANMPGVNQRARNSALGSIGFALKAKAKESVKGNSFGWPQVSTLTQATKAFPASTAPNRIKSRDIVQTVLTSRSTRKVWGALAGLLVYSLEKSDGILLFGFVSGTFGKRYSHSRSTGEKVLRDNYIGQSVVLLAEKLTNGFEYQIRAKEQQRYFAALGFIFPMGKTLKISARPLVGPTFEAFKPDIPRLFREKFWASLRRNAFPEASNLIDTVFGKAA